jgi:hypothetical protein
LTLVLWADRAFEYPIPQAPVDGSDAVHERLRALVESVDTGQSL